MFTKEQQKSMLHRAGIRHGRSYRQRAASRHNGRTSYDLVRRPQEHPRKNSYLYLDSVDACFFYSNFGTPTVTLTARWSCGAKDLDRLADAAELIKTMLRAMKEQTEKAEAPKNEEAPNA